MASDEVSAASQFKYDVFVNFRGTDTRDNFFSHLKDALVRNGINVFTDEWLNVGAEISTTLDSKIRESLVSVVVFSPNYADSRWCLDELVRIMECKKANGQTVLPVFVQGVEPTHVRKQIGAFGEGFGRLIRDDQYADRKASWESALKQAADLSGLVTHKISEGVTVKKLLKSIQSVLSPVSSIDLDKYFIGIEHVEEVESLVLSPNIRCLGIWGMGGSGKTTLAKKIYERLSNNFDAFYFVEKVRESAGRDELKSLQRDMLSQLLRNHATSQGPPTIYSPDIRRKLKITRVLVILDDVSDPGQLKELIGDRSLYCPGSKMIAISRDRQVLKNIDCDEVYEVKALDDHESLRLIKHHILKGREPTPDQMQLLKDAIKYARGLPLALEVLGRNLFDKDINSWRSMLAKLGDIPDSDVMKVLRTSYDGLDDDEKNIFLDIACFMEGWDKDRAERMLDACKFHAIIGIDRLVDRALVTVSYGRIQMHDLLQQMGQDIASGSRLYKMKEIADVLTRKQERERKREIQVISMDLFGKDRRGMELSPRVFKGMTKLRILSFWHIPFTIPGGLKYLSDQLQYLEWHLYPEKSLPPRFNPENLVELRMRDSNLRRLWTGEIEPCLPSLKLVDLEGSKKLTTLPNFKNSSKLETLELSFCKNLKEVPDLSHLTKLVQLQLWGCSEFRILRQLPPSLFELDLRSTKIKKLENISIQGLSRLEKLELNCCEELESLPDNICELKNLGQLNLVGCPKLLTLASLPVAVYGLRSLTCLMFPGHKGEVLPPLKGLVSLGELLFSRSNLKSLPEDIKYLTNLWRIDVSECMRLSCIPELPPSLVDLDASNCISLQKYTPLSSVELDAGLLSQFDFVEFRGPYRGFLRMNFKNCFNLERDARNEIWGDLWLRNQSILIPLFSSKTAGDWYPWPIPLLSGACIPGEQVPKCFKYSNKGPSIQVNTDPLHHSGFYFYLVCDSPTNSNGCFGDLEVTCEGSTESGGTFSSSCSLETLIEGKHTIIWCHHLGLQELSHNNQFDLNGATFHFSAETYYYGEDCDSDEDDSEGELIVLRIVKCGVMPFYTNDDNHHGDDSDDKEDNDDGNNDKNEDYNNKGRQRLSSCTLLAEEELGDACGLDLNFPAPDEEGRGACGFDLNFPAPIEDGLDLDLGLAPPAAERASLVDRPQKRKRGNDEEGDEVPRGHKRNN